MHGAEVVSSVAHREELFLAYVTFKLRFIMASFLVEIPRSGEDTIELCLLTSSGKTVTDTGGWFYGPRAQRFGIVLDWSTKFFQCIFIWTILFCFLEALMVISFMR